MLSTKCLQFATGSRVLFKMMICSNLALNYIINFMKAFNKALSILLKQISENCNNSIDRLSLFFNFTESKSTEFHLRFNREIFLKKNICLCRFKSNISPSNNIRYFDYLQIILAKFDGDNT